MKQRFLKTSGMTLIEVLITMLIMSVGLLGMAGLQATSVKDGLDVAKRSQVTWIANEIVERIRATAESDIQFDREETRGIDTLSAIYPVTFTSGGCATPTTSCSDVSGTNAVNCTANQIALQDIQEVFCGQAAPAGVIANTTDALNLSSVAITCAGGTCDRKSDITITINWISQNVNDSQMMTAAEKAIHQNSSITMTVRP